MDPNVSNAKELYEDRKRFLCPKIVLLGWWWKKYIPYYQRKSKVMNDIMMKDWLERGYDEWFERIVALQMKGVVDSGFETQYVPKGNHYI